MRLSVRPSVEPYDSSDKKLIRTSRSYTCDGGIDRQVKPENLAKSRKERGGIKHTKTLKPKGELTKHIDNTNPHMRIWRIVEPSVRGRRYGRYDRHTPYQGC